MTEKELLKKLNKLSTINADHDFKLANRQVLLAQITQGEAVGNLSLWAQANLLMGRLFQPYAVAIMIALFFVASGAWGWNISRQAKPGDSLYLAKKLSERGQMLMTFDEKAKVRLSLVFAAKRVSEISSLDQTDNQESMASTKNAVVSDFKKEISQAKNRLAKLNNGQPADFESADKSKDKTKIEVSVPDKQATTTANSSVGGVDEVLEEAEKLFDSGDYSQAADKLDQANKLIETK